MGIIRLEHVAPQTSQHSPQGGEQRFCVWLMCPKAIFDGILTVPTDLVEKLQGSAIVIDFFFFFLFFLTHPVQQ